MHRERKSWTSSLTTVSAVLLLATTVVADILPTHNSSLLWGTYRPNLYFGTKPRIPESVMTGLMWFNAGEVQGFQRIRHACDQGDQLEGYGYQKHDGRDYASQQINDPQSNVKLSTEFIKVPGGEQGGDWGVRISGTLLQNFGMNTVTSVLFYVGIEGEGGIDLMSKRSIKGLESPIRLEGDTPELGDFEIQIIDGPFNTYPQESTDQDLSRTQWVGTEVPKGEVWKAKDVVTENIFQSASGRLQHGTKEDIYASPYKYFTLSNQLEEEEGQVANLYVFQKVFQGDFQFDVLFRSQSNPRPITSEILSAGLIEKERAFDDRFEKTFGLKQKGFKQQEIEFAQYLLSNMLGGIGYFHGTSIIDQSNTGIKDEEDFTGASARPGIAPAKTLFTATPSRPFFPRGFYWDEGFHQLLIGEWDNDLSLDIIQHWVALIDQDGWVAREQILGEEARSKVPAEFQTQFRHYANPPTLYLAIKRFVDRLHQQPIMLDNPIQMGSLDDLEHLSEQYLKDPERANQWLRSVYPQLRLNWQWFRKTQFGHLARFGRKAPTQEAYRWRGRTPNHTLTSGLDDYPRGTPSVGELHLDLHSWMAFGTGLLRDIASQLGPEYASDLEEYRQVHQDLLVNLDALHWSEEKNMYCDQALEDNQPVHVCHKGYLSLFPMTLGLLPADSPKLGAILDMIEDSQELWSPYGLRSLSRSDAFFGTSENYWRGPIWLNINYLTLQSLYNNYMHVPGPYQTRAKTIYIHLRDNIIRNVYKEYQKTGYVWEQYEEGTGKGVRSHPFTGWTSLVLLIMAERY
ncbi:glycoside hydrolase [Choanephora cucurbitarum]|nr:glycoside hydrolase [Choanephora cucurbitarum]